MSSMHDRQAKLKANMIIAELSANAATSHEEALALVDAAADSGASAVKIQAWSPGSMAIHGSHTIKGGLWDGRDLADLYSENHVPWTWIPALRDRAWQRGLLFGASVFDQAAIDYMVAIDADFLKIASFELTDIDLIKAASATGKFLIISTGMATVEEISLAVAAAKMARKDHDSIMLMACSSIYPCPNDMAHTQRVLRLKTQFRVRVGYSDHTADIVAPLMAIAHGATAIEKHLMLAGQTTADEAFSLPPEIYKTMVDLIQAFVQTNGTDDLGPLAGEPVELRRGLHYLYDLPPGHVLREKDIVSARPASPTPVWKRSLVPGKTLTRAVRRGDPVDLEADAG